MVLHDCIDHDHNNVDLEAPEAVFFMTRRVGWDWQGEGWILNKQVTFAGTGSCNPAGERRTRMCLLVMKLGCQQTIFQTLLKQDW